MHEWKHNIKELLCADTVLNDREINMKKSCPQSAYILIGREGEAKKKVIVKGLEVEGTLGIS